MKAPKKQRLSRYSVLARMVQIWILNSFFYFEAIEVALFGLQHELTFSVAPRGGQVE